MAVPEPAPTPAPIAAPLPPPAIAPMAAPMAAPPPMVAALRFPREVPTCSYSLLASTYDLPWNCMRTSSNRNSLRPLMCPAERASTSFTYTSVPVGTMISLSTTSGASSEARKISPVWLVSESMASIMRTTTEVPAGNSTCLGCGGGGRYGVRSRRWRGGRLAERRCRGLPGQFPRRRGSGQGLRLGFRQRGRRRLSDLDAHPVVDLGHTRGLGGQLEGLIARGVVRHFAAEGHFAVFRRDFEVRALQLRVGEHLRLDVGGYVLVAPASRASGSQPYRQNNHHE